MKRRFINRKSGNELRNYLEIKNHKQSEIVITGIGVTTAVGQGKTAFISALLQGRHAFGVMQRPGRQWPAPSTEAGKRSGQSTCFLGAEIPSLAIPEVFPNPDKPELNIED